MHNSEYAPDRSPSFDQKFVSFDWAVVAPLGLLFESFLSLFDAGGDGEVDGLKTVGGCVYDEMD